MYSSGDTSTSVGRRFVCDGFFGTILYHGPVPPTQGIWFGVEWDDSTRGKHDGMHEGVRYFKTKHPTSGSFLRPQKADFGVTYTQAVNDRYGFDGSVRDVIDESQMYIMGENQVMKTVEVVGVDKVGEMQSKFDLLKEICLNNMKINGGDNNVAQLTPNVVELDLSKNLLSSWDELENIVKDLKNLKILTLSNNKLKISDQNHSASFQTVKQLTLNEMDYSWSELVHCAELNWPMIHRLYVVGNNITSISELSSTLFQQLESLDMDSNVILKWQEILKLAGLLRLQSLNLNNCGIQSISFPDVPAYGKTDCFVSLKVIGLNDNKCGKWTDVAELNKLKNLTELRMRNNPICDSETPQTVRQLFIAKIGGLKMLNREQIVSTERRGAEIDYLKKFGKIWLEIGVSNPTPSTLPVDFVQEHPRYLEIVNKYGAAEESELKVTNKQMLTTKLLSLHIASPLLPDVSVTKKLPSTITIQKLKGMVQRLLKIGYQNLKLSSQPQKVQGMIEIPLINDRKTLNEYSVEDGDTILVRW